MQKKKLLDQVRDSMRLQRKSEKTITAYVRWIKQYILFNGTKHPSELNTDHVRAYLNNLVQERNISASTQKQAFFAILYCYKVLGIKLARVRNIERPKLTKRVPSVFSNDEAKKVISFLKDEFKLMAALMYGSGLRLGEVCKLRINDIDFGNRRIIVRHGKGDKDRVTLLPQSVIPELTLQIEQCRVKHSKNLLNRNYGGVFLPPGIENKFPQAINLFEWFYLFPAKNLVDGKNQSHIHDSLLQKQIKTAIRKSGVNKPASCHTFRHSFATDLIANGTDIRTVQELMGHRSIRTTQVYLHFVPNKFNQAVSPMDRGEKQIPILALVRGKYVA